jgi:hypothetical protein
MHLAHTVYLWLHDSHNHFVYCLLPAGYLLGLLFDPDDGGSMFFWNNDELLLDCMVSYHITYLNSTETVEIGEPLSTDETTSLFDSTTVFASVLRGTFWLRFAAVCVAMPRFWKWTLSVQQSCTSYQFTCSSTLLTSSEWAAAILTTQCGQYSALVVSIPNAGILALSQQVVN